MSQLTTKERTARIVSILAKGMERRVLSGRKKLSAENDSKIVHNRLDSLHDVSGHAQPLENLDQP